MTDQPFVRVVGGPYAGMTGVLCGGTAGNWLVYLTCHGTYQTVPDIRIEVARRVTGADMRREDVA